MTLEEFQNNLENAVERTIEDLKPTMEEAALTAKAFIRNRIQNNGISRNYSRNSLPTFFFRGKGLKKSTESYLDNKDKDREGVSYSEWRQVNGLPINNVRLTFTGKMFANWQRPGHYRRGFVVGGSVGGTDKATKNKLAWNKARYPNFDRVKEDEKELLKESFLKPKIVELLDKNLKL